MAGVAEMRVIVGDKDRETERAEELRILEALLFAAEGPLDEKVLAKRLPAGVDVRALLTQLQKEYAPRGVNLVRVGGKWTLRTASDLAWLLTHEAVVTQEAVARRHRDARHRRLSPAGDARRDRGNPRRDHLEGHARRAAGDRLDPAARPPQGAGPADDLRHHRGVPVAFRPGGARRSARPRRAQGRRPARRPLPPGFSVPMPSDDPALRDDEDPLEPGDLDLGLAAGRREKPRGDQVIGKPAVSSRFPAAWEVLVFAASGA